MTEVRATPSKADAPPNLPASHRLALSRERLRQALCDISAPLGDTRNQRVGKSAVSRLDGLKSIRGAGVVVQAVSSWWAQHPLRLASMLAAGAVKAVLQPVAQRNPLGLILATAVLGGVLVWIRPWRWIPKSVLFAGLLPQIVSRALAHVRPLSWMAIASALAQQMSRPKETAKQARATEVVRQS